MALLDQLGWGHRFRSPAYLLEKEQSAAVVLRHQGKPEGHRSTCHLARIPRGTHNHTRRRGCGNRGPLLGMAASTARRSRAHWGGTLHGNLACLLGRGCGSRAGSAGMPAPPGRRSRVCCPGALRSGRGSVGCHLDTGSSSTHCSQGMAAAHPSHSRGFQAGSFHGRRAWSPGTGSCNRRPMRLVRTMWMIPGCERCWTACAHQEASFLSPCGTGTGTRRFTPRGAGQCEIPSITHLQQTSSGPHSSCPAANGAPQHTSCNGHAA